MLHRLTLLFPLWLLVLGGCALRYPQCFAPVANGNVTVLLLALIMLGMGMTLTIEDFKRIGQMPKAVLTGFCAQYAIMPVLGWATAKVFVLPPHFAVGLILVGCCPGGTASNLISYIAGADVALSVVMTLSTTLAAVVLTPAFTQLFAGALVPVDGWLLFKQTLQVVLLPVLAGVWINHRAPRLVARISAAAPLVSVAGICLICASVFAVNAEAIRKYVMHVGLAVVVLHTFGFALGYLFSRVFGYGKIVARTVAIEVGMQNSGLAVVLAKQAFPLLALAPVVGALSAVTHSLMGSALAAFWRRAPISPVSVDQKVSAVFGPEK